MDQQEPEIVSAEAVTLAVIRRTVAMDELPAFYDRAFREVAETLARQGLAPTGPAVGVWFGSPGATAEVAAGFPTDTAVAPDGDVVPFTLPGGRVGRVLHAGAYDGLGASYDRLFSWLGERKEVPGEVMWETYLTEPTPEKDPATMRTLVSWSLD